MESKKSIIKRLMKEAKGTKGVVSVVAALEFRRDAYELNQSEFAKILGLSKSHYSEIIHGKRSLPLNALKRAFRIGVPFNILLQK